MLLVAVIYVSAKPINMGIEARRNLKNNIVNEDQDEFDDANDSVRENTISKISEEPEVVALDYGSCDAS